VCYHNVQHAWGGVWRVMSRLVWIVDSDGVGLAVG